MKILKWIFKDTLKFLVMLFAGTAFIVALMFLVTYPVQIISAIIVIGGLICIFTFVDDVM